MNSRQINIDFKKMGRAFREHVRRKAMLAGSTIIYKEHNQLIEEDPATSKKTILKANLEAN